MESEKDITLPADRLSSHASHQDAPEKNIPSEKNTPSEKEADISTLPRVADRLSVPLLLLIFIGGFERFAYYSVSVPWQNYIQHPRDSVSVPGALGLGQATATSISNAYLVFTSLTPLPWAIISDCKWGRYKTLLISTICSFAGCIIQFTTSLPAALDQGAGVPGLGVSMILIGIGQGGIKTSIWPLLGDQYTQTGPSVVEKKGKKVVLDYGLTLQLIYNISYWATNVASLSSIPATFLERIHGFWASNLLAMIAMGTSVLFLLLCSPKLVKPLPVGDNILLPSLKAMICAAKNGFKMDNTKADYQVSKYGHAAAWSDEFVDEVKMTLSTCRILLSLTIFYLCVNQMTNNFISQAGQMELSGVPNDMIQAIGGIACVVLAPLIQTLYALLARQGIIPTSTLLITLAFILCGVTLGYSSGIQHLIYMAPPCYTAPLKCLGGGGVGVGVPNEISVWLQIPMYFIAALSEILSFVTISEIAFTRSPKEGKAIVQALSQLAASLGSLMGLAISPLAKDPKLVGYYASLAGVMGISALGFWLGFRGGEVRGEVGDEGVGVVGREGDREGGGGEERLASR
ncbi:related to PTR2-Di-and tripeptide permease [Ramularia collo-cygni]|uniref:Related to PTR2-Di-and tripeptide permease n=1 Tax=Ramularia collo-cygni TaxID=112498 RepID=A0A2D3URZ6_9PEZI|nr:related to PTR2-Di-and tripeptide permease [Ramularia collo-cygni]CZT14317.1 related to PTR2-Di-and tripeptide permease [Ramularia collo-cygni]